MSNRLCFSERSAYPRMENAWTLALTERRRAGLPILDLTLSDPTHADLPYAEDVIRGALGSEATMKYAPDPLGMRAARETLARAIGADASRIVLTASTSEAYSYLFKTLCDPGDEAIVPQPSYPLFDMLARQEGVRLRTYALRYDGEWYIDFDSLRDAISERSRLIVVVNPNNPTGSYLKKDEVARLASLGLPIVSDEVFAAYPLAEDPRRASTLLGADAPLVCTLGGLSKWAGLPQLKLGWIVLDGNENIVDEAIARLELIADSFLSVSTPVQVALPTILEHASITRNAIHERCARNLALLRARTKTIPEASVLNVEGGWYATLRLPNIQTDEAWSLAFLRESILVQPGFLYDHPIPATVVLSLLTPPPTLAQALTHLTGTVLGF